MECAQIATNINLRCVILLQDFHAIMCDSRDAFFSHGFNKDGDGRG